MRATVLPWAVILTKAYRATVSMMAKGCIVASVLPLTCFLLLLPNDSNISVLFLYLHY